MKKTIISFSYLAIILVVLTSGSYVVFSQRSEEKVLSPFVGTWDWEKNSPDEDSFYIWVGERNDSLLFSIGGVFYGGRKIHMPGVDLNYNDIPMVKVLITKNNIVKSKISEAYSDFHFDPDRRYVYNDISFELINDSTMLFVLDDNKGYWPDTAIMKRRDRVNRKFSYEEDDVMYKKIDMM